MKDNTISRLASLHITWWVLIGLIAWFVLGAGAVEILPAFSEGLSSMNEMLVRTWLISRGGDHLPVLCWLLVLVALAAILAINLGACIYCRLIRARNGKSPFRRWIFTAIHLLFALVMVLHCLEMVAGRKYPEQELETGQTAILDSDWRLAVHDVNYVNAPELLQRKGREARHTISRDRFDMQANFVKVSLVRNHQPVRTGEIRMLAPLSHGRMHVILRGFEYGSQGVTARIRVVSSDLHTPFTIAYALLILGMLLWLLFATPRINSQIPEDK